AMRDTDGDGLPDAWEIANGLNPLAADAEADSDGDGTSDFDEILRGTDPNDATDHPKNAANDPDCDGWSTWDENLRGTNPAEASDPTDTDGDGVDDSCEPRYAWTSTPVARRTTEVEYLPTGGIWQDAAQTTLETSIGRLTVVDPFGEVFFDQLGLPDHAAIVAGGLTGEADLPSWLQATPLAAELAAGQVPSIRIPGGTGTIIRAQSEELTGEPGTWVAKAWIAPTLDLTPGAYNTYVDEQIALGNDISWTLPADWLASYELYLAANAVRSMASSVDPSSGLTLALLEAAVAWHGELSEGAEVLVGNPDAALAPAAIASLDETLEPSGRNWMDLLDAYAALVAAGGELVTFRSSVLGYFADPSTIPTPPLAPAALAPTTERGAAALVQGASADNDVLAAYLAKLYVLFSPAELAALSPADLAALLSPAGDSDGDGLDNATELAAKAAESGNPEASDSDGDGFADALDPCLADPENLCLAQVELEGDDDGDGVVNALDNCLNAANSAQADANGDAIGDGCLRYANIRTPVANVRVYPGGAVNFTSIETEAGAVATGPLAYDWDFGGGAANSLAATPGPVSFDLPGTWPVTLRVSDAISNDLGVDVRTVTVLGDIPLVSIVGAFSLPEGQELALFAAASSPNGAIANYAWDFGDAESGIGANVAHTWAQNGDYSLSVSVADVIGAPATDTVVLSVTDTAPVVSFVLDRVRGPVPHTVQFTGSAPVPYDGLAGLDWDFGDGLPGSAIAAPSHDFTAAATATVIFSATDGDGSVGAAMAKVQVLTDFNLLPDSDSDGISDAFEAGHGATDPAADNDADGVDNLAEYRAGTDLEDPLDLPPGAPGDPVLQLGDDFTDPAGERWSRSLVSSEAAATLSQAAGRLLFELQPPALGELCQTGSLVSFSTLDAEDLWLTALFDPGAAGTGCIGLVPGTDYFARAEACFVEAPGGFDVELRLTEGDTVSVTSAGSVVGGSDLELGLVKVGPDFYLTLEGAAMASDSSGGSLGNLGLRPFVSAESCSDSGGATALDIDVIEIIYAPEPAMALQWAAGLFGLRALYRRRRGVSEIAKRD
ncbi:MAG: PKD domain-containing protein, partial [Myxococcota bacterium]|nr:PKD domain-containing protein [Myxococcota bacterium]